MSDAPERTRAVLAGMGAPESLAGPLVGALGPGAAEELAEDPWRLLALPSITPDQADYCARRALGGAASPDDPGAAGRWSAGCSPPRCARAPPPWRSGSWAARCARCGSPTRARPSRRPWTTAP
ncbi:hypothetical protein ACFQXA_36105 [Nocardiopsis composta]